MKLMDLINETADCFTIEDGAIRVFLAGQRDVRYRRLEDYYVSSSVSGPSIILLRKIHK